MAYKKKTPAASPIDVSVLGVIPEEKRRRIMETGEYAAAMKKYERDMQSIPAMLADILKETTATRLIMEDIWNGAK